MYRYLCGTCGCRLDPGEGDTCDECREKRDREQSRRKAVDRMVRATVYEQMEMEEFLNGKNAIV